MANAEKMTKAKVKAEAVRLVRENADLRWVFSLIDQCCALGAQRYELEEQQDVLLEAAYRAWKKVSRG